MNFTMTIIKLKGTGYVVMMKRRKKATGGVELPISSRKNSPKL
jgi:hypothetical protein